MSLPPVGSNLLMAAPAMVSAAPSSEDVAARFERIWPEGAVVLPDLTKHLAVDDYIPIDSLRDNQELLARFLANQPRGVRGWIAFGPDNEMMIALVRRYIVEAGRRSELSYLNTDFEAFFFKDKQVSHLNCKGFYSSFKHTFTPSVDPAELARECLDASLSARNAACGIINGLRFSILSHSIGTPPQSLSTFLDSPPEELAALHPKTVFDLHPRAIPPTPQLIRSAEPLNPLLMPPFGVCVFSEYAIPAGPAGPSSPPAPASCPAPLPNLNPIDESHVDEPRAAPLLLVVRDESCWGCLVNFFVKIGEGFVWLWNQFLKAIGVSGRAEH
jgi:hypothetical protein